MLDGRLYRAAFVPFLFALVIAGFSLRDRPAGLGSTLPADDFDGVRAVSLLHTLARAYPDRRPGSAGDEALAAHIARRLSRPPAATPGSVSSSAAPFTVSARHFQAATIDGTRTLTDVVATRPGVDLDQIVLVAHRDAAQPGSTAELSGTAALLELGSILSQRITHHTITLVSTSGGSGGDAGAARFAAAPGGPVDAVIAIGDIAGARAHKPFTVGWSESRAGAPPVLSRTLADALAAETSTDPGSPSLLSQFDHLALPQAAGEQGPFDAAGLPAVLVQASGENGPAAGEAVGARRMQSFGRAILNAVNALDSGPAQIARPQAVLLAARKLVPEWAVRLLVGALLLPAGLAAIDALARVRRRREAVGRWLGWIAACTAPFLACALFSVILGRTGLLLSAAPGAPVSPRALPLSGSGVAALVAVALVGVLGWVLWPTAVRLLGVRGAPTGGGAGAAALVAANALAWVVWVRNPFAAALAVPAVHLWMAVADPRLRPRRAAACALVLAGLALPAGALALYARQLALGPADWAWMALVSVAGGHVDLSADLAWSLALGCAVAMGMIGLRGAPQHSQAPPVSVRGPLSYAGPGSLGGTESALRR